MSGYSDPKEFAVKRRIHRVHGKIPFFSEDARQWASWGVDYLKYDWNPIDVEHAKAMSDALRATGRDIVYSLSNLASLKNSGDWARLSQLWRTTGDITDTWASMSSIGFDQQSGWTEASGPGHWNDPDMLVVGQVGWGSSLRPSRLSHDEQYTHVSLWALLAAPLLIGCDLTQLDDFTLSLLSNDDVLDIDQDDLGRQGRLVRKDGDREVYVRALSNGDLAVGLFNRGDEMRDVSVAWKDLGINGRRFARDLWHRCDIGLVDERFTSPIPSHGVQLLRLSAP